MTHDESWEVFRKVLLYGGIIGFFIAPWKTAITLISICVIIFILQLIGLITEVVTKLNRRNDNEG